MKRIRQQVLLALFLLSNNFSLISMEQDEPQQCDTSVLMQCFKYVAYSGMFSFALYQFGNFFYGGYRNTLNQMQRRTDLHTRILGTMLAANAGDKHKVPRIQELLHDPFERQDFLGGVDDSDKQALKKLFPK